MGTPSCVSSTCREVLSQGISDTSAEKLALGEDISVQRDAMHDGKPGVKLVSTRVVARTMDVDERTVRRWCNRQECWAVLTPGGRGVWRVWVDAHGLAVRR